LHSHKVPWTCLVLLQPKTKHLRLFLHEALCEFLLYIGFELDDMANARARPIASILASRHCQPIAEVPHVLHNLVDSVCVSEGVAAAAED